MNRSKLFCFASLAFVALGFVKIFLFLGALVG
jgi:hypothetical protein